MRDRRPQRLPGEITPRTHYQRALAQTRDPRVKAQIMRELAQYEKNLVDIKRERQALREQQQEVQQPVPQEPTPTEPQQTQEEQLVPPIPEGELTSKQLLALSIQIDLAKTKIIALPPGTTLTMGDKEVSKREALQLLSQYKTDLRNLQTKLKQEGNLQKRTYQDPETKQWQTVVVSDREAQELAIWSQSYQEAENLYNELQKEGNNFDKIAFVLGGFIDPNDPLRIKTIATMLTSNKPREDVIKVIAESKYQQYTAREKGWEGVLGYTLQMPVVQYGMAVVGGTLLGAGVGAISQVAPKAATIARVGMGGAQVAGAYIVGSEVARSYAEGGVPEASATLTRTAIPTVGFIQGYRLGYPVGQRIGTARRAIEVDYRTGVVRGGARVYGDKAIYWKSTPISSTKFKSFDPTAVRMPPADGKRPSRIAGYLPESTTPKTVAQSEFYGKYSITFGQDKGWQPQTGIRYGLEYPPSTYVAPKPTLWKRPGPLSTRVYPNIYTWKDYAEPIMLESGLTSFSKQKLVELKLKTKPRIYTMQDVIKPYQPPKGAQTTGQRQQLVQLQKQITQQKKIVKAIETKLKTADLQAQKLKELLASKQAQKVSYLQRQSLLQEQQMAQMQAQQYAQRLYQARRQLKILLQQYATAQEFEQAQQQESAQIFAQAQAQEQPQEQAQQQKQAILSLYAPYAIQKPKTVKPFKLGLPLEDDKKPKRSSQAYDVYVGNKKANITPLTKQSALGLGADLTDKTVATKFKIKQIKGFPTINPQYQNTWPTLKKKFTKRDTYYHEKKQYQNDYDIEKGKYRREQPSAPVTTFKPKKANGFTFTTLKSKINPFKTVSLGGKK